MPDGTAMVAINVNCLDGVDPRALPFRTHDGASALTWTAGAVSIGPVRSDADVAAASALARAFFAYMRETYPEQAMTIDAYLDDQDFEGQLADFRSHFNPPTGRMPARPAATGEPVGIVMLKPYGAGVCETEPHVRHRRRPRPRRRPGALRGADRARRALGYREIRLDTLNERVEALPLYRKPRLWPRPRPARFTHHDPDVISMRLTL